MLSMGRHCQLEFYLPLNQYVFITTSILPPPPPPLPVPNETRHSSDWGTQRIHQCILYNSICIHTHTHTLAGHTHIHSYTDAFKKHTVSGDTRIGCMQASSSISPPLHGGLQWARIEMCISYARDAQLAPHVPPLFTPSESVCMEQGRTTGLGNGCG